jgi:hypothetical protein
MEAVEQTMCCSQKIWIASAPPHKLHADRQSFGSGRCRHGDTGNMNGGPRTIEYRASSTVQSVWRLAGSTWCEDGRVPVKQAIDRHRALDLQSSGALDATDIDAMTSLDHSLNLDTQLIAA